ncbi:Neurexin-4 [Acropora cervicornis]|uniref:Neurexin-4 n=1 Tax=Acropora cervicornis TaxID=6130 RepID=A0AAD9Q458_ACRCE|nr:Neurexin-4 [Acropora cervicornis]
MSNIELVMLSSRLSRMAPSRELAICGVTAFVFIVCSLLAVGIPTDAEREKVPNEGSCRVKCYMEPDCVSINVGPLDSRGEITCELNDATWENGHESDMKELVNYTYLGIENHCHSHSCIGSSTCQVGFTSKGFRCKCRPGGVGDFCEGAATSCSEIKSLDNSARDGDYVIDPDGEGGLQMFRVSCDMTDKNGVGVTVISHNSENRTLVDGYEKSGSYKRDIKYMRANLTQLTELTKVSLHCEQSIKYECYNSRLHNGNTTVGWWMSRDDTKMTYWDGASGINQCACAVNGSCARSDRRCNCDKDDSEWRFDSGLLTNKIHLPVKQLRFGDTGVARNATSNETGYHTLGKFRCYGIAQL